jgi:amphi-Trp domain-containing protein
MTLHKKKFHHQSIQDTQSVLKILSAVIAGLEQGQLVLSDQQNEITLSPQGLLALKLTACQDDDEHALSLKMRWQTETKETAQKNTLSVYAKPK